MDHLLLLDCQVKDDGSLYISHNDGCLHAVAANNTLDKNVLLAPNKSIFSSASYDKRQEDVLSNGRGSLTSRYRSVS